MSNKLDILHMFQDYLNGYMSSYAEKWAKIVFVCQQFDKVTSAARKDMLSKNNWLKLIHMCQFMPKISCSINFYRYSIQYMFLTIERCT